MPDVATQSGMAADLLGTQGPVTAPLDAAAEYLRRRIEIVLPLYTLAMLPHAAVIALLIDAISGERRALVDRYCMYLVLATVWRWVWLAWIQHQVQRDLYAQQRVKFRSRILAIILLRLISCVAITWGSLIVVPSFFGLFVGSFAAPALLEREGPVLARFTQILAWTRYAASRLFRILTAVTVISVLLLVAIFVSQTAITELVLPNLLGIDTTDINVTIASRPWRLGIFYLVFLLVDAFWSVASVFIYYDSQSRRMATDLRARLVNITGAAA